VSEPFSGLTTAYAVHKILKDRTPFEKGVFDTMTLEILDFYAERHDWKTYSSFQISSPWEIKQIMVTGAKNGEQTFLYFLIQDSFSQEEFYARPQVGRNNIELEIKEKKAVSFEELIVDGINETIFLKMKIMKQIFFKDFCDFLNSLTQTESFKLKLKLHFEALEKYIKDALNAKDFKMNFSFLLPEIIRTYGYEVIPLGLKPFEENHHPNNMDDIYLRKDLSELMSAKVLSMKRYNRNLEQFNTQIPDIATSFLPIFSLTSMIEGKKKTNNILYHPLLVFVVKTEDDKIKYFVTELFDERYHSSIERDLNFIEEQKHLNIKLVSSYSFDSSFDFAVLLEYLYRHRKKYDLMNHNCKAYVESVWNFFSLIFAQGDTK